MNKTVMNKVVMNNKSDIISFMQKRIVELLNERQWTLYRLAKESGLSNSTVNNLMSRGSLPSIELTSKIARAFGLTLSEFFDSEILNGNPYASLNIEEQEILDLYLSLKPNDRERVKGYIEGLLAKD